MNFKRSVLERLLGSDHQNFEDREYGHSVDHVSN